MMNNLIGPAVISLLLISIGGQSLAQDNRLIGPGMLSNEGDNLAGFLEVDPNLAQYLIFPGYVVKDQSTTLSEIGLIDSGVNADHPQLRGRITEMRSFTDAGPEDRIGHGTSIAIGMLGLTSETNVISANVLGLDFSLQPETVQRALRWLVAEKGLSVINASLGFRMDAVGADELCKEIDALVAEGHWFLLVAAAGNLGPNVSMVPADCDNKSVVAVASDEASSGTGDLSAPRPVGLKRSDYLKQLSAQLIEAQRLPEALRYLMELKDLDPEDAGVVASLAGVAFAMGQTPLARNAAKRWTELRHDEPEAHWVLALTHANLGDFDAALESLDRVIALDPKYKRAAGLRTLLASQPTDLQNALRDFFGQ